MAGEAEGDVHVGAPPDDDPGLSPIEQALQNAEAELGGDDEGLDEDPPQPEGDEPPAGEFGDEGEEEADDQHQEDEEEEGGAEDEAEDLEEGEAVVELPESLKEQGYEDLVVPEDQRELFQALTASYETREQRETAAQQVADYEQSLMDEAEEFRLVAATDPFRLIETTFAGPQDLEESLHLYLMSDPKRWKRHLEFIEDASDDEAAGTIKERLQLNHEKRTHTAARRLEQTRKGREAGRMAQKRVVEILEKIAPGDRDFVKDRLFADIRAASARKAQETGSDIVELSEIDKIARPWLERFGDSSNGNGDTPPKKKAGDPDAVAKTQSRLKAKAQARKRARKQASSSGSGPGGAATIPKGAKLDDVLKGLKAGKL